LGEETDQSVLDRINESKIRSASSHNPSHLRARKTKLMVKEEGTAYPKSGSCVTAIIKKNTRRINI